ncbi:MAG TPA: hypothetical protein PK156_23140 [Polyangium sp.]|nr:hypothetical protein [Polyangium sp.]
MANVHRLIRAWRSITYALRKKTEIAVDKQTTGEIQMLVDDFVEYRGI